MTVDFHPEDFMKYLTDKSAAAGLDTLKSVLNDAANSESKFVSDQAVLTAKYLGMKNRGEISGEELQSLLSDMNAALEAELLKLNMTSRIAAQKLMLSLLDILKGALSVLITVAL
jgi:hypothetical protein